MTNITHLNMSEKKRSWVVWILLFVAPLVGMAIDIVSPSLPSMMQDLHVTQGVTKNVISFYLLGYALGNFSGGLLTDSLGRRKLLLVGLFGAILTNLSVVFFPYMTWILIARFLQGLMIGCLAVVTRAVLADLFPAEKLTRIGVLLGTMFGIGPIIGPFVGGYLQYYFGWQATFIFFAIAMFIELVLIFYMVPETHFKRMPFCLKTIQHNLKEVIQHREFVAMILMMGSVYSLIIAFNIVGPFLIQTRFHYSAVFFGIMALCMGVCFLIATLICRRLLTKYTAKKLFYIYLHIAFFFALIALVGGYFFENSIIWLSIFSGIMFFSTGFVFPMCMGYGASLFKHIAGTASATMFLGNILMTSLTGFVLSFLSVQTIMPLMWIYILFISFCLTIYLALMCKKRLWQVISYKAC